MSLTGSGLIKDLKPVRASAELVVIIVGVLTALWVDEWREERDDRALETQYLQGLATDVRQDLTRLDVLDAQILNPSLPTYVRHGARKELE